MTYFASTNAKSFAHTMIKLGITTKGGIKTNLEELEEFFDYCQRYYNMKGNLIKKTYNGWYMAETLTFYAMLNKKQRNIFKKCLFLFDHAPLKFARHLSYKNSMDEILSPSNLFFEWEVIQFMFDLMLDSIQKKYSGFSSKTEKRLIKDFSLFLCNSKYDKEFNEFIIDRYGNEGKKILMEFKLGGK